MRLLERVLASKDARAHTRVAAYRRAPSVGELALNVPGWPKRGRAWLVVFARGLQRMLAAAPELRVVALRCDDAGYWALLLGPGPARRYKACACRIEAEPGWGRLLDFDWYADGLALAREALGEAPRSCWVCGGPQQGCIGDRRHELELVRARALQLAATAWRPR